MRYAIRHWFDPSHRCAGRTGPRRFGFFGGMIDHGGRGLHGFRSGRKLGADDLQLVILALLEEKPRHGYEIIKALDERSGGFYSPSPGMVYPALTYLDEIGYATVESEGTKKLYRITAEGQTYLDGKRAFAEAIFAQMRWVGSRMEHVRRAFERDDAQAGDADGARPSEVRPDRALHDARNVLRAALASRFDADAAEQKRIADILERAAREILQRKR
jgi:DNA-binding PadR family transcriptional regulator